MGRTFYFGIWVIIICFSFAVIAEEDTAKEDVLLQQKSLIRMSKELKSLEERIYLNEKTLETSLGDRAQKITEKELEALLKNQEKVRERFLSTAASVDLSETKWVDSKQKKDFLEELQNLLLPLVDGLQRASARPRKIEGLKTQIEHFKDRIDVINDGIANVQNLIKGEESKEAPDELLLSKLKNASETLKGRLSDYNFQREERVRALDYELSQGKSLKDASTEILRSFFGRRGKNFILAIIVFILGLWGGLRLRKYELSEKLIKRPQLLWLRRPLRLIHNIFAFIFAFSLSLITLYFLNDWALLTFFTLILLSIVWSLKQLAPKFINEARFLLNLGTVKEGERVIWKGIPYKVKNLGPTSILENERLQGGWIRVAAKDLSKEYSRPLVDNEPWFPSEKGDFMQIGQNIFGEILLQTPEQVILRNWDSTIKYYSATDYLNLSPVNLKEGFTISKCFHASFEAIDGINEVVVGLEEGFSKELIAKFKGIRQVLVDFKLLPHSLVLSYKVSIDGQFASQKVIFERDFAIIFIKIAHEGGIKPSRMRVNVQKD